MRPDPNKVHPSVKAVLNWDVNTVAKAYETQFPVSWKRMFTKTIDAPGNYYSSKALAVGLTGAIEEARIQRGALESNAGVTAGMLEQYDFPIYYVSAPIVEAMSHSHPPQGLKWSDVMLPFPALTFMLPRGSLQEPKEFGSADIILLGIVKIPPGKQLVVPTVGYVEAIPEERTTVFWLTAPSALTVTDCSFPSSHPLEPIKEWIERATEGRVYYGPSTGFSVQMAGLVANFILLMEARKELVEPGRQITRASKEGKPERWLPTYIGRNYSILRKEHISSDAKAHFTELGWRAGHFKRQHFGLKSEQVKTIFVDPYIAFTRGLKPIVNV